jgi:O-antigen/teichoic acid export membrane protein
MGIDMWYYIWTLHYLLVKKIYRKRIKGLKKGAWSLAFLCLLLLLIFILTLLMNKSLMGELIGSGVTLAPIGALIVALILIPILFLSQGLTRKKINTLRKVIVQTQNVKRIFSILYISFFILLYISTIIIWISTVPYHSK